MTLLINISQLVTVNAGGAPTKTGAQMRDLGVIEQGAVVFDDVIRWVGRTEKIPSEYLGGEHDVVDCTGQTVMPGFVDSHTHMVFAGSRAHEYARRLSGVPYTQIAAEGGGILTTMNAVRQATVEEIYEIGERLVMSALEHGTTTVEIKSGYGLSTEAELKLLDAIGMLQEEMPSEIHATFLGAHDVPPEYKHDPDAYVTLVVDEMLDLVKQQNIASAVDVFTDKGFFTVEQSERILDAARERGFDIRIHADEIANIGASLMAARYGALSADHLEFTTAEDMRAMRDAGVVATLLPGTAYTLRLPY
ncbi:MAG: imidazolonepropionase, partial [Ignavibacteriae bacterium]